ncbi:MAG: hypothetical protein KDK99_22550 [Verrucomicrobiales bacterium]|nr:hypothetical protein [Verrucomicrobiales bacterium]
MNNFLSKQLFIGAQLVICTFLFVGCVPTKSNYVVESFSGFNLDKKLIGIYIINDSYGPVAITVTEYTNEHRAAMPVVIVRFGNSAEKIPRQAFFPLDTKIQVDLLSRENRGLYVVIGEEVFATKMTRNDLLRVAESIRVLDSVKPQKLMQIYQLKKLGEVVR